MRELTLKQKNEMIDFMVDACIGYEEYDQFCGICYAGQRWLEKTDRPFYFYDENDRNVLFPELNPQEDFDDGSHWFDEQSERIIYLLLVKEFINR